MKYTKKCESANGGNPTQCEKANVTKVSSGPSLLFEPGPNPLGWRLSFMESKSTSRKLKRLLKYKRGAK